MGSSVLGISKIKLFFSFFFGSLLYRVHLRRQKHVQQAKQSKFLSQLLPGWGYEDNYGFLDLGKIWVLWHPSVNVTIISKSLQMVTCEVKLPQQQNSVVVSFVYAANDVVLRKKFWEELVAMYTNQLISGKAWCVLGDFNQVLNPTDHFTPQNLYYDPCFSYQC